MSEPPFGHTRAQRPWFHLGYEGPESRPERGGSGGGEQRLIAGRSERSRGESPALRGLYQGRARGPTWTLTLRGGQETGVGWEAMGE